MPPRLDRETAMTNPWEAPPLPAAADEDIDAIYRGVGRVITAWEGIEVNLSRIYSMLHARPDDLETIRQYGEPLKFAHRFSNLQSFARRFFVTRPNQEIEGRLDDLAGRISSYSSRRNEIAHSLVNPIQIYPWFLERATSIKPRTNYWALIPSYHNFRDHVDMGADKPLKRVPAFVYTSNELKHLEVGLNALYGELSGYREKLRMFIAN
jgi:hypothetical protein